MITIKIKTWKDRKKDFINWVKEPRRKTCKEYVDYMEALEKGSLYFQTTENTVTIKDRTITLSRHSLARRPHEGRPQDAAPVRRLRPQPPA